MKNYRSIIREVAKKNGVSYEEAYRDMQEAVSAAYHSDDPEAREIWSSVKIKGDEPTVEEFLEIASGMLYKCK